MKRKIDIIALGILIAAAVNCGLIGVFKFNVMTWLFNGQSVAASRIIYVIVAVAGLWCVNLIVIQDYNNYAMRYADPAPIFPSDPKSLKDNPADETVCSPFFSQGCINEDTDLPTINEEENAHEKH